MTEALFILTQIDPATGARIDTDDDELTEKQLDNCLANALEVGTDRYGNAIYRFAEGWFTYIQAAS